MMEETTPDSNKTEENVQHQSTFKKPILIGKVGRLPRKTLPATSISNNQEIPLNEDEETKTETITSSTSNAETENTKESKEQAPLSYIEPTWSGVPQQQNYKFEVLKAGVIIETINLIKKPFWVFGRLPTCDVYQAHPTVSRYHAILQYKNDDSADRTKGFYIYDLGSTHGTFLNKNRIKPKLYVRIQVGHMLKLGCSTRTFLLLGPEDDTENETELTVTELKQKRNEELRERELREIKEAQEREQKKRKEEERGVDWGMGEDADEETDLQENPYAESNNEDLYFEDPKKTLRGFMEREGHELHYEVTERGVGQFLCSVVLPVDDPRGRPILAEALVKGKKKEAVVQCALEACRILDRHGVLRQAMHESKKRKAKNWEENDYYDSDEDTFLDRTGTIERKREKRMKSKVSTQPETYQSLCEKEEKLSTEIRDIEKQLNDLTQAGSSRRTDETELDSLDQFMNDLTTNKPDKYKVGKLKIDLNRLKKEHTEIVRLVNIARPAHLPPLVTSLNNQPSTSGNNQPKKSLPIFGKRLKVKVMLPARNIPETVTSGSSSVDVHDGEEEDDETLEQHQQHEEEVNTVVTTNTTTITAAATTTEEPTSRKGIIKQLEIKMSSCDEKALASLDNKVKAKISKTVTKLRKIAEEEERIVVDEKRLAVQKKKIFEQINTTDASNIEKQMKLTNALTKMTNEFCTIGDRKSRIVDKINKLADDINKIAVEIRAASKVQHEKAVNRMKEFVEKAHKQQTEIFGELEKIGDSVADQKVLDKLKELYEWLTSQKVQMLDNLERLKNVKITEDAKLLEDIIEFEVKSDKFITTILDEIRKIRENTEKVMMTTPPKQLKTDLNPSTSGRLQDNEDEDDDEDLSEEKRKRKNLRRIAQRQERAEQERKKQYEEDATKEDYNMWVPPEGQTGDGRTSLNDKFGY